MLSAKEGMSNIFLHLQLNIDTTQIKFHLSEEKLWKKRFIMTLFSMNNQSSGSDGCAVAAPKYRSCPSPRNLVNQPGFENLLRAGIAMSRIKGVRTLKG
jgi:hypothetical protein